MRYHLSVFLKEERSLGSSDWRDDLAGYAKVAMNENRIGILQMLIQDFRLNTAAKITRSPSSVYMNTSLICLAASRNEVEIFELFVKAIQDVRRSNFKCCAFL